MADTEARKQAITQAAVEAVKAMMLATNEGRRKNTNTVQNS